MPQQKFAKTARSSKQREASLKKKKIAEAKEKLQLQTNAAGSPDALIRGHKHVRMCGEDQACFDKEQDRKTNNEPAIVPIREQQGFQHVKVRHNIHTSPIQSGTGVLKNQF
jgi:hypothetical protein